MPISRVALNERFSEIFEDIQKLREAGQKEYAHDENNAFANFERVGTYLGQDREAVLMVYALKHFDGITAYVRGHQSQREDVRGRIKDLIVYMLILHAMVDENAKKEEAVRK